MRFCATLKATGVNIFRTPVVRKASLEAPEALAGEKPGLGYAIFFFKELGGTPWGRLQRCMAPVGGYVNFDKLQILS